MPVGCIDHLPSCVYVWRVYTSTCVITLVSLVIGEIMFGNSKIVERVEDSGNGLGWSIIEWDWGIDCGSEYELAVLRDGSLCYDSGVTEDVVCGDWSKMEKLKCMITDLEPNTL